MFALAAAVALAGFAFLVVTMQGLPHDLRTANEARDALAQQVERLGESPVAGPPGPTGAPGTYGQSVVGPAGPKGDTGPAGPPVADDGVLLGIVRARKPRCPMPRLKGWPRYAPTSGWAR
ncbi:hypothetical protein ACFTXM_01385 [Streptomyces sp. NPDC056930]|uniref:hypothetical protein n=1 Tax=Streptomyces sp. NPDC056930 TaxID=3345967 RepID=UPI0036291CF2